MAKVCVVAVAGLVGLVGVATAHALVADADTSYTQPSNTLVMPFDVTEGRASFLIVSNTAGTSPTEDSPLLAVTTHWMWWSDSCDQLADVWICLTLNDTIVVDPRNIVDVDMVNEPSENGTDLSGNRGMVIVTAYATDEDCSGGAARSYMMVDNAIVGTYTFADIETEFSYGNDAIGLGLNEDGEPQLPKGIVDQIDVQTFNPSTLDNSTLVFLSLTEAGGSGTTVLEIGPNRSTISGALTVFDNAEVGHSLPDYGVQCVSFASMKPGGGLVPTQALNSSGFLRVQYPEGTIGGETGKFMYGIHGQSVGQFGGSSNFKYLVESSAPFSSPDGAFVDGPLFY
ncbi:MAG: hypothetical protein VCC00_01205 [Deltaproteobacteria bacterium]